MFPGLVITKYPKNPNRSAGAYIYPVEPLLAADIGDTTTEEGSAKNQEKVWENGAQQRVFHHCHFVIGQR